MITIKGALVLLGLIGTAWFWPEGTAIEGYGLNYSLGMILLLVLIVSNLAVIADYFVTHSVLRYIDKFVAKKNEIGRLSRYYLAIRNKEEKAEDKLKPIKNNFSVKLTAFLKKASYPFFLVSLFAINLIPLIPFNSAFTVAVAKLRKTKLAFEVLNILSIIGGNTLKNFLWVIAIYHLAPTLI